MPFRKKCSRRLSFVDQSDLYDNRTVDYMIKFYSQDKSSGNAPRVYIAIHPWMCTQTVSCPIRPCLAWVLTKHTTARSSRGHHPVLSPLPSFLLTNTSAASHRQPSTVTVTSNRKDEEKKQKKHHSFSQLVVQTPVSHSDMDINHNQSIIAQ